MTSIIKSVYQHPSFSQEALDKIAQVHEKMEVQKGEVLLKKGQISPAYYLLESGLVRAYVLDIEGNEIVTEFFSEGDIVIAPASFFQRNPSQETLQAITDAVLWRISFESFQEIFHGIPGFTEWGRLWFTHQLLAMKQRSLDMITQTATNRYLKLMETKPQIIKHAPLKQIATYLGVTDTSLSRIRKEITT
ncbi:MAG TPA: Crp/Fnr family transcriptional regulator [Niabella sp.]|nr:Crp/Fnr family transcriptional regulator [Niabella sp.]HRB63984.1 Crp/Fnr family transcriptional regulator [Niabella sp.]HRB74469.1 Crp/Fnr family transcriptional regulator [Niabella sp.]HRC04520.1 Crp/Fnr family transcriptional regulator [Niabella sp.]HRC28934.1 Crp/Fnr family transcriptional regulator [Niabella sp.]